MGLFSKKEKQAMEVMNERNKRYLESVEKPVDNTKEEIFPEGTFEKGDLPAIIISALIVFLPVMLIMVLIVLLAFRVLING
ncbi:MAG: hypothetical protein IJ091_00270 [Oscillospiraceae bacterium]|nr:hypothetical protein [Oscillospiraceae bacterium]